MYVFYVCWINTVFGTKGCLWAENGDFYVFNSKTHAQTVIQSLKENYPHRTYYDYFVEEA